MENKIKEFFLDNPETEINIRSLAKKLKTNQMTVKRKVENLVKKEVLTIEKKKLESIISLNKDLSMEKRLHNIKKVINSGLIEYLERIYEFPKAIVLFGSYSFGENTKESDIDIAIQTDLVKNFKLEEYEKKLGYPIQIFLLNTKTEKNLKMSIYNGLVLRGRIQ